MKLYLMIGCPGSGKSTFARNELMNRNTHYVSKSGIRASLHSKEEKEVFKEYVNEIKFCLNSMQQDVIADATHLTKESRTKLLKALKINHKKVQVIAVYMKTDLQTCIRNNEKRAGFCNYVLPEDIRKMYQHSCIVNLNREKDIDSLWEINYQYKEKQAGY